MLQLVITVLIVSVALGFSVYRIVRYLRNPLRGCDGCDQNCGGCSLEDLKKVAKEKKLEKHRQRS